MSLEALHRFHTYCARFPSEIVEAALAKYTKPGDSEQSCVLLGFDRDISCKLSSKSRLVGH